MHPELLHYLQTIGLHAQASPEQAATFRAALTGDQLREAERIEAHLRAGDPPPGNPPANQDPPPADPPATPPTLRNQDPPPADPPAEQDPPDDGVARERRRVLSIRELAGPDTNPATIDRAIAEGWSADHTAAVMLREMRDSRPDPVANPGNRAPAAHIRHGDDDATVQALAGCLMLREGLEPYNVPGYVDLETGTLRNDRRPEPERARSAELAERFSDLSLYEICQHALRLDGRPVPQGRNATIRAAIGGNSLSAIFTQSIGAMVLSGFMETADTTQGWTVGRDVPNFLTQDRIHVSKTAGLTKHKKGGTADHVDRDDQAEQYKVHRYSRQFVVDEMDIVNDRLGAIEDSTPQELGAAARRLVPDLVYSVLLANANMADGVALFHASHNNLLTSSALAPASLRSAVAAMLTQQIDGVNCDILPYALVVPQELRHYAGELIRSAEIRDTTASTERGTMNAFLDDNLVRRSDSRLDNGVTDPSSGTAYAGSTTTWFLASRGGNHTIEIGYLRGTGRRPQVRVYRLDRGQWGIGWDVKFDVGAKALHWAGLLKATA